MYERILRMMKLNNGSCSVERFEYYMNQYYTNGTRRELEDVGLIKYSDGRLLLTKAGEKIISATKKELENASNEKKEEK